MGAVGRPESWRAPSGSSTGPRRSPLVLAAAGIICGAGLALAGSTFVKAADEAGIFEFLRSEGFWKRERIAQPATRPGDAAGPRHRATRESFTSESDGSSAKRKVKSTSRVALSGIGAVIASRRSVCVRVCDGYTFPLGNVRAPHDLAGHKAACEASCPGAETRLYTLAPGQSADDPSLARSALDGSPYAKLSTAFLFRKERIAACSCQGPDNVARRLSILLDPTLRSGDIVVDKGGEAKVYAGSGRVPHSPRAFADFRGSRALSRTAQAQIDKVMGVSQREANARAFQRTLRVREAAARARDAQAVSRWAALREVAAPAGSAANVRVYSVRPDAGRVHASGARIIEVR